jgi:asparagine synthase (glutamine-hydrolysing)
VVSDSRLDNRPELMRTLNLRAAEADEVGDGELLHAAYQRWGEGCAEQLLGDFAFAVFDPRESRVLCARDVMGVRPFYYHHAPHRLFALASEADALLSHAEVPADLNHGRIADALVGELEGIDRTSTFYAAMTRHRAPALRSSIESLRLRDAGTADAVPRGLPSRRRVD